MNNWFPLFSILLSQQQLKKANASTNPPELMMGLFPAFQTNPLATIITNKAVVDREIAKNDLQTCQARSYTQYVGLRNELIDGLTSSLNSTNKEAFKTLIEDGQFQTKFPTLYEIGKSVIDTLP